MLGKLKKSNNKGFTIIEVMIVLAIAGLILLIVFLAVPALQRSSRNTQRKTDVGRLGSAATTIISNANGSIVAGSFNSTAIIQEVGTFSYYDFATVPTDLTTSIIAPGGPNIANLNNKDKVTVVGNGKCVGTAAGYAARQVAVLYTVESGSSTTPICIDQ